MLSLMSYDSTSKSANDLARALNIRMVRLGGSVPHGTTVINWGSSKLGFAGRVINKASAVQIATDKLATLKVLKAARIPVPEFTTEYLVAKSWQEQGYRVVLRHKVSAHSGHGIEVAYPEDELIYAPLYTKYKRKDKEFRAHVVNGRVIDLTEKRRRFGEEPSNSLIRTHENGWVYCRDGVVCSDSFKQICVKAVAALGLDFGAVDFVTRGDKMWVLEVNTAPGICGTTLSAYANAFRRYL